MERLQKLPTLSKEISSPRKQPADAPIRSKSGPSPTSNKRRSPLVIDTKDDRESERNDGDANRVGTPTQTLSPTTAALSKLITNIRSKKSNKQRLLPYQASPKKLSAIQLVNSKYGVASPKSRPNLAINTKDETTTGSLPDKGKSPRVSPSLFQQSTNKVDMLHRSLSNEASDCDDCHEERRKSPAAVFSKLQIGPTSPMADALSGRDQEDDKTAARVSNFIDSLHQKKGITVTPRGKGNNKHLPPKSPSAARLASNSKYSSILSNARNVIASSPVARANAAAAVSKVSPQSGIAIARRGSFFQKSAGRYNALDSDSSDSSYSSDDDCSSSSDSSNEVPASTQKEVGDFIDTLNGKNQPKVKKDTELLSSLKAKLNTRRSEKEIAAKNNREMLSSFKAQLGAQEKTKCEPSGTEEKKDVSTKVTTPQDYASKHNIKKDVNYYAILSQIQKAVQSDNPSLLMGKIFADAGKRGMKLAMVTEMIKEEKLKAKGIEPEKLETGTSVGRENPKQNVTKACVLAKEQLAAMTNKVDQPAEKAGATQKKKQSTADIDIQSIEKLNVSTSPSKEQPALASKDMATSLPKPSSKAASVVEKSSESESNVSSVKNLTPPTQDMGQAESRAVVSSENQVSFTKDSSNDDSALMSEVEARIKEVVRSATPSIEFGKILADAKKKGLPTNHLIRLYKQEREELMNAAVKAASLVIKPECDNEVESSRPEGIEVACPPKSITEVSMKEKLTKEVQNAVRSSNPSEMLGKILADAKSKGMPTEWLFELYTKERMKVQMQVVAAKEQAKPHVNEIRSTDSEESDVSEVKNDASSDVATSATMQRVAHTTDVVDFFSKFSLQAESKESNVDNSGVKQNLTPSVSEVSEFEVAELNEEMSRASQVSEILTRASTDVGFTLCEVGVAASASSKVHFETAHADKDKRPAMERLWKSPLQKERLSRRKLSKGGKSEPINGVAAAASLTQKRRLRGPRRTHLMQSTQERTKEHCGFLDIDFYSLYESTTCNAENEEIDKAPWEYRDVRQRFLSEKSVDCRNWFGSFESTRGNDRISNPVPCPKSLQIPVTKIPESGDWNEDWYTTWKSRRDNPNNLVTFTEADIPSLSMNSSGTSSTSTTMTGSHSYDQSVESSDTAPCKKKAVLIEIGNIVSVRFGGERVSKVHPDYTSSLRRSRWRKKYMRGEFAFDTEM